MGIKVTPSLCKRAEDLMLSNRYGRKAIQDKDVPFIERLPLSLKPIVSNQSSTSKEKACMEQMMSVMGCLSKFDQNEAMCEKEIGAFNKCYTGFKANASKAKAFRESGVLPLGQYAKMSGPQMNEYMSSFAYGGRKRRSQYHANSVYKEGAR